MTSRTLLFALVGLAVLACAQAAEKCINDWSRPEVECCSKCYDELKDEPCDPDHYCTYVNWDEYAKIQVGGIGCTIACTAVTVIVVMLRDIMKVWDCFGSIYQQPGKKLNRQLTTMSAAYAAETMPSTQMPQQGFQQMPVPMGQAPMQQMPMQQMPMQTMPMQPMPMQTMPMQTMPQMQAMPQAQPMMQQPVYMGSA